MDEICGVIQAELNIMDPIERVRYVAEEYFSKQNPIAILGKDAQELRVVQAIASMQAGEWMKSVGYWRRLAAFSIHFCPPFEESLTVYATNAALCMFAAGSDEAQRYAKLAVGSLICGPFRSRMQREVNEAQCPKEAKEKFWNAVDAIKDYTPTFAEVAKDWNFTQEEIPPKEEN